MGLDLPADLVELASGIDALYLSCRASIPAGLAERLEAAKCAARESAEAVPFEFGGYDFQLSPAGMHKYRYRLDHPAAVVAVTPSEHLPAVWIQARAETLHSPVGPAGVVSWAKGMLANEDLTATMTVSRVDLHADWQGWAPDGNDRHRFVCRAKDLATYEDNAELTGFTFGTRKSGSMTARIYDKTKEILGNGHDWWIELWGDRYQPDVPVFRVEFEFGRSSLRELDVTTPADALDSTGELWAYATEQWLTFREPGNHADVDRWPVADEWEQIRRASMRGNALPRQRITAGRCRGELRRLMPGLNGYVAGFAAWTGHDTIEDACAALPEHLRAYERTSGRAFCSRVHDKRKELP